MFLRVIFPFKYRKVILHNLEGAKKSKLSPWCEPWSCITKMLTFAKYEKFMFCQKLSLSLNPEPLELFYKKNSEKFH